MQDRRWDRFGAIAGILFVLVAVAAAALTTSPPMPGDTDQVFKDFFVDKHDQLVTQAWLYALGAPLLLWFAATVRRVLRGAEGDEGYLADLFLAGTTADAALLVAAMAMQVAIAKVADRLAPEPVRGLGIDFGAAVVALFGFIVAITAFAFAAVVLATNVLPRWTAWLAAVAVMLNVVGTVGVFSDAGPFSLERGIHRLRALPLHSAVVPRDLDRDAAGAQAPRWGDRSRIREPRAERVRGGSTPEQN